jgi:plastocyanin
MRHPSNLRLAALAAVVLIGVSGCGSSGGGSNGASTATTSPDSHTSGGGASAQSSSPSSSKKPTSEMAMAMLSIKDFAFQSPSSVKPGGTVMVSNSDTSTHSVTSDQAGMFDVDVSAGGTATFTAPSKPGSYPYHCKYHGNMQATLVVK